MPAIRRTGALLATVVLSPLLLDACSRGEAPPPPPPPAAAAPAPAAEGFTDDFESGNTQSWSEGESEPAGEAPPPAP